MQACSHVIIMMSSSRRRSILTLSVCTRAIF
jgi:hypothetical protein